MKVLYLTDNRDDYKQGNYYVDWLNTFRKKFPDLTVYGPGYETRKDEIPSDIDLVIYGHAFMEILLQKKFRIFSSKKFYGLDIERFKNVNSLMFSKNEYKLMDERIEFLKSRRNSVLVCYTRMTLETYKNKTPKIHWAPFGIDPDRFFDRGLKRDISIGMRGNRHTSYIGQLKEETAEKLKKYCHYTDHDIVLSDNGEHFLFGEDYLQWLNRCMFVGNTKSAMDIVNPKFAETIACGAIPLCPVDEYEGLLEKDVHYVDMEELQSIETKEAFIDFYREKKSMLDIHREDYIKRFSYSTMLEEILKKL